MKKEVDWDRIPLSHDALFGQVMRDPTLCKTMLEKLLGFSIESISYPETQKTFELSIHAKGIRMDIFVKDGDGKKVYTVEMQTKNRGILGKRIHYYQGIADMSLLQKGESYDELPTHYVIFICTFDPFGYGKYRYSFDSIDEELGITLNDGTHKLFFNTKGKLDDVPDDVKKFLRYLDGELSDDPYVLQLEQKVREIKNQEEWREYYMTFGQLLEEEYQYGLERGLERGLEQGKLESAKSLVLRGSTYEYVSEVLGISIEKIKHYIEQNLSSTI